MCEKDNYLASLDTNRSLFSSAKGLYKKDVYTAVGRFIDDVAPSHTREQVWICGIKIRDIFKEIAYDNKEAIKNKGSIRGFKL